MATKFKAQLRNWKGEQVKADARKQGVAGLTKATEYTLETANRTAPIDTGAMVGSGSTAVDSSSLIGYVGYDTPYAPVVHEDMTMQHAPGRRAKWLELTVEEQRNQIVAVIAENLGSAFE